MARIICTEQEYTKMEKAMIANPNLFNGVRVIFEIVERISTIPKDYLYDTETKDVYVYRHKYTGDEIHIAKNPKTYILQEGEGEDK